MKNINNENIKNKKKLKYLWLILPLIIIIGLCVIFAVNHSYHADQYGADYFLKDGERGTLTLYYNGAEGYPESDTITYEANKEIELPTLQKKGYVFVGWSNYGAFAEDSIIKLHSKESFAWAMFTKDFSDVSAPVAIYKNEDSFDEFDIGEYPSVSYEDFYYYVDGGTILYTYSEENFGGKENKYVTSSFSKGEFKMVEEEIKSIKIVQTDSETVAKGALDDTKKQSLLYTFAPRIYWSEKEEFFACSVETAAENMTRVKTDSDYRYIIEELDSPGFMNTYLHGSSNNTKSYAFATKKDEKYLDLSYFVFTPYNKAKEVLGMQFGNHIGDWEHITVRLMKENKDGTICWRPIIVCYSAHDFVNCYAWGDIEKTETTHPIAYTACGSHGMWAEEGSHTYVDAVVVKLKDECSRGTAWDLWKNEGLETYSYDSLDHKGYGIGKSEWKDCFDFNYYDEGSNAVSRWGNYGWYPPVCIYPMLEGGPTGPQHKPALYDYYSLD